MSGWRLFWALVGYVAFIVILIFLYFYKPFEDFFTLVINGLGYGNAMFWIVLIAAIVGFCGYHWRAYRLYIVQRHSLDGMVLASLRGSAFIAVLFCAGAAAQSLLILCTYLLQSDFTLGDEPYKRDWHDTEMHLYDHVSPAGLRGVAMAVSIMIKRMIKRQVRQNPRVWAVVRKARSLMLFVGSIPA